MVLLVCGFCEQTIESTDPTTKHIIHTKKGLTIIKCLEWSENFQRAKR